MTAGLLLMKNVINPLAKNVFLPLGLSAGISAAGYSYGKKLWIRHSSINNFK